jgi:hypothetical protein
MIIELLTVLSIQVGGMAFTLAAGIGQLRFVIPIGFIAGMCIHIIVGALQSVILLQTWPLVTMILTALLPGAWWYLRYRRRVASKPQVRAALVGLALVVAAAGGLHVLDRANLSHVDSHEYLAIGSMLEAGTFQDGVSLFQLEKRMLTVSLQHAPANLSGDYYLASLGPLLGAATVFLLALLCQAGLRSRLGDSSTIPLIAVAAVLLLVTTNRFVLNLFYVNSHLLVGTLLLLLAGTAWVNATRPPGAPDSGLLPIQLVALPVLVIARPEGALLAAIVIAPIVLSRTLPLTHRSALVTVLGGSVVIWQLFLLTLVQDRGGEVTQAIVGMLAFGAFLLATAPLLQWRALEARPLLLLSLIEGLLWGVLLIAVVRDPEPFADSVSATVRNTIEGDGGWGLSLVFLAVLALLALVATRASSRIALRYPVTMFVPLMFLLVYLREGAYRVGPGDSLNRMLIHIVPLTVLFLASTAASKPTWISRAEAPTRLGPRSD